MREIITILLCLVFILAGCSRQGGSATASPPVLPSTLPSSSPSASPSAVHSEAKSISETLTANDKLLSKYIKASGNGLISLVGLGDLMDEVKNEAQTASEYTDECLDLTERLTERDDLSGYYKQFTSVQSSLNSINDKVKEAKQNKDIDEIESALRSILSELQDYNKLLEQFIEKER
ncbi:hypothetical protein D3C81_1204040 [compost metagenome]